MKKMQNVWENINSIDLSMTRNIGSPFPIHVLRDTINTERIPGCTPGKRDFRESIQGGNLLNTVIIEYNSEHKIGVSKVGMI